MNIFITGPTASGKSSVGKVLASNLKMDFFDTDIEIERKAGVKVADIYMSKGDEYFRKLEAEELRRLTSKKGAVISTGGGAIVDEGNFIFMKNNGVVVTLVASPESILERVKHQLDRPVLRSDSPLERIKEILFTRAVHYSKGDIIIDTSDKCPKTVAEEIITYVRKRKSTFSKN